MEITVLRTINFLYYIIGLIAFCIVATYVYTKREDRKLVNIFVLGIIVGVGFELLMAVTGQRNLYIEGLGYSPFLSTIMGLFEIAATTTMAYVFGKRLSQGNYSFSLAYLVIIAVLIGLLPILTEIFSYMGISWIVQPIISEKPFVLFSVIFSVTVTTLCFIVLWIRIKSWRYILNYFIYLIIWGSLYVIILLLTGSRGYQVVGTPNELFITILLVMNSVVFEVAGLMLAPIALGALFKIQIHEEKS